MRRSSVLVMLILALGGCVRTLNTDFAVPAPGLRTGVGGAEAVGFKVSVNDIRSDKTNIGTSRNVPDSGDVFVLKPRQPVEEAVSLGIQAEFQARGFRHGNGPAFLLVDIATMDSTAIQSLFRANLTGNVALSAQVVSEEGRVLYTNLYRRSDTAIEKLFFNTHDEGADHLAAVLGSTIRTMAEDDGLILALIAANRQR